MIVNGKRLSKQKIRLIELNLRFVETVGLLVGKTSVNPEFSNFPMKNSKFLKQTVYRLQTYRDW